MTTTDFHARVQVPEAIPSAYADSGRLAASTHKAAIAAGVTPEILELIKIRASQLNGCSFCLDMHTRDALAAGESQRRVNLIAAWQETELFTPEERIALELTEVLTRLAEFRDVSDDLYERAIKVIGPEQYAAIVYNIAAINVWNRLAVASHKPLPE